MAPSRVSSQISFRPNKYQRSATHQDPGAQERAGRAVHVGPCGTPVRARPRGRTPYEGGAHAGEGRERDANPLLVGVVLRAQNEGAARV